MNNHAKDSITVMKARLRPFVRYYCQKRTFDNILPSQPLSSLLSPPVRFSSCEERVQIIQLYTDIKKYTALDA